MLDLSHKNLEVYKTSLLLVKEVYSVTKEFPKEEQYVLVSQLRRAVISVCSNIAEGVARKTKPDRRRFYEIARSSLVEIDTQLEASLILKYANKEMIKNAEEYVESVFKMLSKMISNLET
jgi:four helix bundle protein